MTRPNLQQTADQTLIDAAVNDACSDSYSELKRRHGGICIRVASKYKLNLFEDLDEIIWGAIRSYNKKSLFSTWLWNSTFYFCMAKMGKFRRYEYLKRDGGANNFLDWVFNSTTTHSINYPIREWVNKIPDVRARQAILCRYFDGDKVKTMVEVGKVMKVSRQTILNLDKKAKKWLATKIT
jgi:hypothetical protein